MGKHSKRTFTFRNDSNDTFSFTTQICVDRKGIFSASIPKEMQSIAQEKLVGTDRPYRLPSGRTASTQCVSGAGGDREIDLCADSLDGLCEVIDLIGQEIVRERIDSCLVIIYCVNIGTAYWIMPDGVILPNGGYDPDKIGRWAGTRSAASHENTFSVGIGARIAEKRIHTRSSGSESVTYHYVRERNFTLGPYGKKLNDFVGLEVFNQWQKELRAEQREIPYTEPSAQFFCEALEKLCRLSEIIRTNLDNPDALQEQIRLGSGPLALL